MSKRTVNFIVDLTALAAMVLLSATGSLIAFVLPPGSGHFQAIWGMDRHDWGDVHFWLAVIFVVFMLVHLCLHWSWIVATILGRGDKRSTARTAATAVVLLASIGLAAAPFFAEVQSTGDPPHKARSNETPSDVHSPSLPSPKAARTGETHVVQGSMTLEEVEEKTGVEAATIIDGLKLPSDTPKSERLGRLKRRYGFEMGDVERIIEKHSGKSDERP